MDTLELFRCCKKGDLETIRSLVEQRDVDVNVHDIWDSSPLYYACLCGHQDVVEYLIGVGARCEANTFDGERCLYGALTDEIRRILTHHNLVSTHTIRRDAYDEFLRRLYENGEESDIKFIVKGREFLLHRCLLAARSPYFSDMFSSKWQNRRCINITSDLVDDRAFDAVMRYIYTGRFEAPVELVEQCLRIAENCKLSHLRAQVQEAQKEALALQVGKRGCLKITTVVVESDTRVNQPSDVVAGDLRDLVQMSLPSHLRVWPTEMPFSNAATKPTFPDVCFMVEDQKFMCHKMFFRPRSEYFRALLDDHFQEAESGVIPVITLNDVTIEIFCIIINYLYSNQLLVTEENAMDVLEVSDMYLIKGLVRQCAVFLGRNLSNENVLTIHTLSRLFNLPRLEDQCVAFLAQNIEVVIEEDSFRDLVKSDASDVQGRQETDTITIIDELRFHITSNVSTVSDIQEANSKLAYLEDLLDELGIEG